MNNEVVKSLDIALSSLDPKLAEGLKAAILSELNPEAGSAHAIDYTVGLRRGDGFVFHYSDLLGIDDMVDAAAAAAGGDRLSPEALVACLKTLLKVWSRLRALRVAVSAEEIRVLRQIRSAPKTAAEVAAKLGLDETQIRKTLEGLVQRAYMGGGKIPLVTLVGDRYSTPF